MTAFSASTIVVYGLLTATILTHFLLNSAHFLFFAYPHASGVM